MSQSPRNNKRLNSRRFRIALAALCVVGLLLRLAVCLQLCRIPSIASPAVVTDMATYRRIAGEIAAGQWPTHFYYQPFYYAVFLPLIYAVFGTGPWGPALVQACLGTLTVWLTGLTGARLFGRQAGLFAAAFLALARFAVFYAPFLLIATLQSFWMALIANLSVRYWRRASWRLCFGLGLTSAAAILTRGNVLLLVPGIVLMLAWRHRSHPRQVLLSVTAYLALTVLPQLPFSLRNYQHFGRWTGPSNAQDAVLALGNTPEAPAGGLEYPASYHDWVELANRPTTERTPVSRSILAWLLSQPLQVAELKFRGLLLFWHRMEIPNNVALDREGRYSSVLALPQPLLLNFSVIGFCSLAGMVLCFRRRSPPRWLLYYLVVAYCAGTVLFYILGRFRLPLVPVLCLFAGALAPEISRRWRLSARRGSRRQGLLVVLLALVVCGFVVGDGYTWYGRNIEAAAARAIRSGGTLVATHRRTLLYDHGPLSLGGFNTIPISDEWLHVAKTLVLPEVRLRRGPLSLRIPVTISPGTRFEIWVDVGGSRYGTDVMTVEKGQGIQRLVFRLDDLPTDMNSVVIKAALRVKTGALALAVDSHRWYDRTALTQGEKTLLFRGEAAFELEWLSPVNGPAE